MRRYLFVYLLGISTQVLTAVSLAQDVQEEKAGSTPIRLEYGPDTTVFTEPLRADGTVDYVRAINDQTGLGVAGANNGFVDIARVMPPSAWPSRALRAKVFEELGVPVPGEDAACYVDFMAFAEPSIPDDKKRDQIFTQIQTEPWRRTEHPVAAAWVDANQVVLDAVAQACEKEQYWEPWALEDHDGLLIDVLLPQLAVSRNIARLIAARALLNIGQGDIDTASADILLLLRYSRLPGRNLTLISNLVGISVSNMGNQLVVHLIESPRLTRRQARQFMARFKLIPELTPVAVTLDQGERFLGLDAVMQIGAGRSGLSGFMNGDDPRQTDVVKSNLPAYFDTNHALREVNKLYDLVVECGRSDDYTELKRRSQQLEHEIAKRRNRSSSLWSWVGLPLKLLFAGPRQQREIKTQSITDLLIGILMPALDAASRNGFEHGQQQALTRVAVAVAVHKLDHGQYPDTLASLVPAYLDQEPIDWFNRQPLWYKHNASGFIVYSVGRDQDDDHGRPRGMTDPDDPDDAADLSVRVGGFPEPKLENQNGAG